MLAGAYETDILVRALPNHCRRYSLSLENERQDPYRKDVAMQPRPREQMNRLITG
jgi:hypothetical protein